MKVLSLHWSCSSITSVGRERVPPYSWELAGRVKIQASHMVSTDPTGTDVITTLWDEPCFSDTFPAQRMGHLITAWQGWNEGITLGLCWCESGTASFFYDVCWKKAIIAKSILSCQTSTSCFLVLQLEKPSFSWDFIVYTWWYLDCQLLQVQIWYIWGKKKSQGTQYSAVACMSRPLANLPFSFTFLELCYICFIYSVQGF